jgi:hypothetical protein
MKLPLSVLLFFSSASHFLSIHSMDGQQSNQKSTVVLNYPWIKATNGVWVIDPKSATVYISSPEPRKNFRGNPKNTKITISPNSPR